MSLRDNVCPIADSTFNKQPCQGQIFSLDIDSLTWSVVLEDDIFSRHYHASLYMSKYNALFVFGGERYTQSGARETLCINSDVVMLNLSTFHFTLLKSQSNSLYGCCLSYSHFDASSILITGGYMKNNNTPVVKEKPMTTAMVMVVQDGRISISDTVAIPEYAMSVRHTIVRLSRGSYIMLGGTTSQISIFTDQDMDTDVCPASVCIIEKTDVTPIIWIQCSLCDGWYHLVCIGLEAVPKGDYHCSKCKKACKQKCSSGRTSV